MVLTACARCTKHIAEIDSIHSSDIVFFIANSCYCGCVEEARLEIIVMLTKNIRHLTGKLAFRGSQPKPFCSSG